MEQVILSYGDLRRIPDRGRVWDSHHTKWVKHGPWWHRDDGEYRLLGTELKRQAEFLYVLRPFDPYRSLRNRGLPTE